MTHSPKQNGMDTQRDEQLARLRRRAEVLIRERFADFSTKEVGKGSGLSLAVVRGIMKAQGGAVSISSTPGEDALVRCWFPASDAIGIPEKAAQETTAVSGSGRILYLDVSILCSCFGGFGRYSLKVRHIGNIDLRRVPCPTIRPWKLLECITDS